MAAKTDLSKLPTHFRKVNRWWYVNGKTGKKIHKDKIAEYVPKEVK